jgi:uncharacterized membrane protein
MTVVEKSIEVEAPVSTVYNQWTQFESFPQFMEGVEAVEQRDDKHLHWRAKIGGQEKKWDAEISEQVPDQRIAWRSVTGAPNAGVVTFHRLSDDRTRVMLQLEEEPENAVEKIGDAIGVVERRVEKDLERFREFIERRGVETGAWRGSIQR